MFCFLALLWQQLSGVLQKKLEGKERVLFSCPITGIPANGRRFVMMKTCGCVLSEKVTTNDCSGLCRGSLVWN